MASRKTVKSDKKKSQTFEAEALQKVQEQPRKLEAQNSEESLQEPSSWESLSARSCPNSAEPCARIVDRTPAAANEESAPEQTLEDIGYHRSRYTSQVRGTQMPKSNLRKRMQQMFLKRIHTDFVVHIGDVATHCHLAVLKRYSKYFRECPLNGPHVTLPESKVAAPIFNEIYEWMVKEDPKIERATFVPVLSAAYFLEVTDLVTQCWQILRNEDIIKEDGAFMLYWESRKYGMTVLRMLLQRISKFFLTLVASKEFLALSVDELMLLLSSSKIAVNSEMEVFMSVVRWLASNWDERQHAVSEVSKCIRFGLLPTRFLYSLSDEGNCWQVKNFVQKPDVAKIISHYLTMNMAESIFANNPQALNYYRQQQELNAKVERQWLSDPKAEAHYDSNLNSPSYITFHRFNAYLTLLSTQGTYWQEKKQEQSSKKEANNLKTVDKTRVGGSNK